MSQAFAPTEQQGWCSHTNTPDGRAELTGHSLIFLRQVSGRYRQRFALAQRNQSLKLQLVSKPALRNHLQRASPLPLQLLAQQAMAGRLACWSAPQTWCSPGEQELERLNRTPWERNNTSSRAELPWHKSPAQAK